MSQGIKLVRLSVKDVGVIKGRVDIRDFAAGINVISGRNEAGKSTLVEALRAALFERHDSGNKKVRALQTHGTRNAPEVWVELDVGGERVSVHKRFLESPLAEVRLQDGGSLLVGADAEDRLLARLSGRRPGRGGSTRNDMGLWGLLWVAQDETAYTDPGCAVDGEVRGALADVIGRHVGHVLGGKHGERLRGQVAEHYSRYFTGHGAKTGAYRTAEEQLKAATAQVNSIEQTKAQVESLAAEHQELEERLREAESALRDLEREHEAAVLEEHRGKGLESASREAEAKLARAKAEAHSAAREVDARVALARDVTTLEGEIRKSDEATSKLTNAYEAAKERAERALDAANTARSASLSARAALDAATHDLDRARRRDDAARAAKDLSAAEELASAIADAERSLAAETINEDALARLEGLAAKSDAVRSRLNAEGTRIVVYPAAGEPVICAACVPATIDVPGLGALEVTPARPGLGRALVDAEKLRAKLEEALHALEVADVASARERHATRAEMEREERALRAQKKSLAPKGIDALERDLRAIQDKRARLEAALDEASSAVREREECARMIASNRFDEAAMEELRRREQEVFGLRIERDAKGTRIEVLALTDLRVRAGDTQTPQHLVAGARIGFNSTEGTVVLLDEVAQIHIEPRGEDLAATRARLDHAERELSAALERLGVATIAEAAESARAWVHLNAAVKQAERRLTEAVPKGIEKLRADVEQIRAVQSASETTLADARRAIARHAQLEVELSQNRVTLEALERLIALERDLREADTAVTMKQARIRAVSGPVAAGPQRAWTVTRATRPDAVQGIVWEIIPGEVSSELDADRSEGRLHEALSAAGVADLDAAKARFRDRLTLETRALELRKQLRGLAPDGLDALRSRAAPLEQAVSADRSMNADSADADSSNAYGDTAAQIEVLQRQTSERRESARELDAASSLATEAAEEAARDERVHESALRDVVTVRREKVAQHGALRDRLAALREVEPDEALYQRSETARWAHEQALTHAKQAAAEVAAASPDRLEREAARSKGAIDAQKRSIADLHDKALRCKALLDKAALDGHFEELGEAQAEQLEADETYKQLDREARAALLLARVVHEVYAESQRRFLEPVLKEATPYLNKLRPETEIRMSPDFKVDKVVRHGKEEDFGQLSGGTREQLAVIVRLALARVMSRDKRPLPLILDDTLGWTDDGRFLSMVQILREAASDLQIILLTCHPARFHRFHADLSVDLDQLREAAGPA